MPKYLLRLRKTSFFLIFHSSAISLGSNKAFSKDEDTWHLIPPLKILIDASSLRGSPLSMGVGSQAWDSRGWLPSLSTLLCDVWLIFCCFIALWVSSSWVGWDLPTSTTYFPFCSLFLFGLAWSGLGGRSGWGGGRGDLGGGGGSFDCVDSPVHLFWAEILSNPLNSFGISSVCPSHQKWWCSLVVESQCQPIYPREREVNRTLQIRPRILTKSQSPLDFLFLLLLLPPLPEEQVGIRILLLKGWP